MSGGLNEIAQKILHWPESSNVTLMPQFILGKEYVLSKHVVRLPQMIASE